MESFFGAMSGIGIILAIGYLLLTIFIIVYFFRMANDIRDLKDLLGSIERSLIKQKSTGEKQIDGIESNSEKTLDASFITEFESRLERLVQEAKDTKLKNIDMVRGSLMTLSLIKDSVPIISNYKMRFGISLFDDIKSIDIDSSKINYVLAPFIEKGLVDKK